MGKLTVETCEIEGLKVITPTVFGDNRGYFVETYNEKRYEQYGIKADFVQDNMSYSATKGTLRGLHFQKPPYAQAKLVSCSKGAVIDVAVDIRKGSPTYLKYVMTTLSKENHRQLFIPKGFAHAFVTITDEVEFRYKCDEFYNKESESGIRYDDPQIQIPWEEILDGITPTLSEKDKAAKGIDEIDNLFVYGENC